MVLNQFFQQGSTSEQNLVQSLINEQLKMYGVEVHYMPRKYLTTSTIMKEVIESKFDDAYPLEAYVENFDGYGENDRRTKVVDEIFTNYSSHKKAIKIYSITPTTYSFSKKSIYAI